ncbi:MAG TPA: glycosyltransferase family 4 protein [Gaiellaceae bacterium]|nr:glycosyltransferase family 4 protein [Gaiellaceae bacterium]
MSGGDILYFNTWYRGHNNARYEELLPRLERVRPFLLTFPRPRLVRAAADRAWRGVRSAVEPSILRGLQRRRPYAFVTDLRQLPAIRVPAFIDIDDLDFTEENAALLRESTAVAYAVTAASAAQRLEELGVELPWEVVPQGVALDRLDERAAPAAGAPVVGYLASFLLVGGDRGSEGPLYNVEHLLDLWEGIHARVPEARLWLVGAASERLRRRVAGRDDIRLFGMLERGELLAAVRGFDVAVYPRAADPGIRASKVAEYLGAGVPVVAYDLPVVDDVREAGAGILVSTADEFRSAVVDLLSDDALRSRLAAAAALAGARRDWRVLAQRYAELLDRHLPPLH